MAIVKSVALALRDDTQRFMERYPVLFMAPDQVYRSTMARVLEKLPEHIPIAAKLASAITALLTLGMLGLGILIGANQSRLLDNQTALLSDLFVDQLGESVKVPLLANDASSLGMLMKNALRQDNIVGMAVFSDAGMIVTGSGAVPSNLQLQKSFAFGTDEKGASINWTDHPKSGIHPLISFVRPIRQRHSIVGYILLSFDRSALIAAKEQTIRMAATTTILMIGLGILASFILGSWLTRPINDLIRVSRSIVNGNYDARMVDAERKDEIGMIMQSMNTMGQGLLKKEQVEKILRRYVSDSVAKRALKDLEQLEQSPLACDHVQASVLFADIAGFTSLSESASPKQISELLNLYFSYIAKTVRYCRGHIDKFIGDCAMIVFGVPEKNPDHAYRAIVCAWMIQQMVERVNERRIDNNEIPVQLRIGINSGTMVAGNMGSAERMNYTVVGDAVNIASRLSHTGEPGEIIITEEVLVRENLQHIVRSEFVDTIKLRGRIQPVSIVRVIDIDPVSRHKIRGEITKLLEREQAEFP